MWYYDDKEVISHEDLLPECTDIVYIIYYEGGKKYIGKKAVRSLLRKKPTKKQLEVRKNYVRKEWTNLSFVNYEGSLDKSECPPILKKEILYQCRDRRSATYLETALLFQFDTVLSDVYLNKNILGKFFDNALEGLLDKE